MLSVIMLHYGDHQLEMTHKAIANLDKVTEGDYELILWVNGGYEDESTDSLRHYKTCLGTQERLSLAAAYNLAALNADGDKLCIIHNDCFPEKGWDQLMLGALSDTNIVFPQVKENETIAAARGIPPAPKGMPPSCCFMLTRRLLDALWGWDEQFEFCHFEDLDLFQRAGELVRSTANVFHLRGVTRADQAEAANEAFIKNSVRYAEKHGYGVPYPTLGEKNERIHRGIERRRCDLPTDPV